MREIEEIEDLGIVLADGCRLSARVWRPVDCLDDPVPAILEYLPYRKRDGTCLRDALTHPYFAKRGYASVRVDMRGNGDSDGLMEDEYTAQELSDACEVIEWLAAQAWCSGPVGMMGISWGGFNGLQVAALQPEPLKAVISLCSTVDRYGDDIHYKGGCLLNENMGWGSTMWAYSSRAPDPLLRADWREMWLERLESEPFLALVWLRHQRRDAYWKHGSISEDYSAVKAKVLAIGGWADGYKNAVPALVENLDGAKGIVGPWVHLYPHYASPEPRIGFLQEALRWWDRWLKGIETGVEDDPAYRAYLMDGHRPMRACAARPGRWIADAATGGEMQRFALGAGGVLGGEGAAHVRVASPATCGLGGAEYYAIGRGAELSGDQRVDDLGSAVWRGAPLEADYDIVGAPKVRLRLSCDKPQGQVAVRLNHVHPDGAVTRITYGVLNLCHRGGHDTPEALVPGEVFEVAFALDHIAYRVPEGHRIAVAVSTAYWPLIWPAPEAAALIIEGGALDLPIRARAGADEWSFEPPEGDAPWQVDQLRAPENIRRLEEDFGSGMVSLIIEDDFGKVKDRQHGLISGGVSRERWEIHPDEPQRARAITHWTEEMERGDIKLRTETYAQMHADGANFYLTGRLEAYENDVMVYERDISESVPRDHL
ncbi:CocE/NonD family hydrolase [Aquicoccus sp. G2-2]|uniref:CocE/NonD family hydrolase n=1 Tax=Aquicoccus sp. G2-2 TaxID=3092120 RepID=UPI002AE087F3|nr:CocE/NonD family hydrolase [Aquicoccus sp. G2-2]MEA1114327.1 CocE/NonD family hydrolase [Aquicoccus sp. G2-2]